jgi:hypothetical protein
VKWLNLHIRAPKSEELMSTKNLEFQSLTLGVLVPHLLEFHNEGERKQCCKTRAIGYILPNYVTGNQVQTAIANFEEYIVVQKP